MYYISQIYSMSTYGVTDTTDGVEEHHTVDSIMSYVRRGVKIWGVTPYGIFVQKLVAPSKAVYAGERDLLGERRIYRVYIGERTKVLVSRPQRTAFHYMELNSEGKCITNIGQAREQMYVTQYGIFEGSPTGNRVGYYDTVRFGLSDLATKQPWATRYFCKIIKSSIKDIDSICSPYRVIDELVTSDGTTYHYVSTNHNDVENKISDLTYSRHVTKADFTMQEPITKDELDVRDFYTRSSYNYTGYMNMSRNIPLYRTVTKSGIFYNVLEDACYLNAPVIHKDSLETIIADVDKYNNCYVEGNIIKIVAMDGVYRYNIDEVYRCFQKTISSVAVTENIKSEILGVNKKVNLLNNGELASLEISDTPIVRIPEGTKEIGKDAIRVRNTTADVAVIFPSSIRRLSKNWIYNCLNSTLNVALDITKVQYSAMKAILKTSRRDVRISDIKFDKDSFVSLYTAYLFTNKIPSRYQTNLFYGLGSYFPKYTPTSAELLNVLHFIISEEMKNFDFLSEEETLVDLPYYLRRGDFTSGIADQYSSAKVMRLKYAYFGILSDFIIDKLDYSDKYAINNFITEINNVYLERTELLSSKILSRYNMYGCLIDKGE